MKNRGQRRLCAMASAIALLGSMASLDAHALTLGRIKVQSALGELLRAEIDLSDLSADEASSLRVGVAAAETFKAAGLDFPAAAVGLEMNLQRRANGQAYLRVTSNRAMTEPFVDLIVEAKWAAGRVTRDYTMLFDPPNVGAGGAAMVTPISPGISRNPIVVTDAAPRGSAPRQTSPSKAAPARAPTSVASDRPPAGSRQVTVKPGDNASKIAARNKPANVSLDQMLVALLRSNPNAFVNGNINIIKSGAVLDIPEALDAATVNPADAGKALVANSADFNAYKRKLAEAAPASQPAAADRQASGKVQAQVNDRAQPATAPDKLTLSKGSVQDAATAANADKAQKEKDARDAASRVAELSKNNAELNKLGEALTGKAAPALPGVALPGTMPASGAAEPGIVASPMTGASADVAASLPAASAPVPAASAAAPAALPSTTPPVVKAAAPAEQSLLDKLQDNSLAIAGGVLLALLAGIGISRFRKTSKSGQADSSFLDSRLQPDSFFGASGGQRIDTSESNVDRSSIAYSPSQMDGADVDPVAEADVYLAYGRDQQAEEILTEALRTHPKRLAIHSKLLEIYSKRRDIRAFENVAKAAMSVSRGNGAEWAHIAEMGRALDPINPLFQGQYAPSSRPALESNSISEPTNSTLPMSLSVGMPGATGAADLDFNLDLVADNTPATAPQTRNFPPPVATDFDLDLDSPPAASMPSFHEAVAVSHPVTLSPAAAVPDFFLETPEFKPQLATAPPAVTSAAPVHDAGMLEFDLSSLSLDLEPATVASDLTAAPVSGDPLEVKFMLAEEFRVLGDSDGARALADEVVAKAKGPLKVKAQAFLNKLL